MLVKGDPGDLEIQGAMASTHMVLPWSAWNIQHFTKENQLTELQTTWLPLEFIWKHSFQHGKVWLSNVCFYEVKLVTSHLWFTYWLYSAIEFMIPFWVLRHSKELNVQDSSLFEDFVQLSLNDCIVSPTTFHHFSCPFKVLLYSFLRPPLTRTFLQVTKIVQLVSQLHQFCLGT